MAARIVVPESVAQPYEYYRDNVAKSMELFDELVRLGKPRVLFSSSASLYAFSDSFEVDETSVLDPGSPYARTKPMMEMVLRDMAHATDLRAVILRYFNPIGSDPELQSGVHVREPSHVLGRLVMAARGLQEAFVITGTQHPTRDGTGLRDYIHVWDLARAHVAAIERFDPVLDKVGEPSVISTSAQERGSPSVSSWQHSSVCSVPPSPVREAPTRPGDVPPPASSSAPTAAAGLITSASSAWRAAQATPSRAGTSKT
jgi:UDP-glucose 4-epimerase